MERTSDKSFTDNYKKSLDFELALKSMNDALSKSEKELYKPIENHQSTIHVIGSPRSGTTLLMQVLLSRLDVGYINNLIATTWKAPLYGIHLSKKLFGADYVSTMQSDFGRTSNILEPHEFGYFWAKTLNYTNFLQKTYDNEHSINWEELKHSLYQMALAFNKPVLFKSFIYGFHSNEAIKKMPKTLFVYIERDIIPNALSILKFRKKVFGDKTFWASMRPHQYHLLKDETIYRQIIGQIMCLNFEYKKQLRNTPDDNKLFIKFNDLCKILWCYQKLKITPNC